MQSNPFYDVAVAEEAQLIAELKRLEAEHQRQRTPVLRKLEAARSVKAAYSPAEEEKPPRRHVVLDDSPLPVPDGGKAPYKEVSSHKGRVTDNAALILASDAPMKTPILLERLEARGIEFHAKDKLGNLSAILSRDDRFVSDRRSGWSLTQKNPQDAATSTGSLPT